MAHTPEKITLVVEQITERQMRQRIAQAKADALIEFAQHLPEPWDTLRVVAPTGPEVTLEYLLQQRADEIIRESE